jgi:hypothetical protein
MRQNQEQQLYEEKKRTQQVRREKVREIGRRNYQRHQANSQQAEILSMT